MAEGGGARIGVGTRILFACVILVAWFEVLLYALPRAQMFGVVVGGMARLSWPVLRRYLLVRGWCMEHPELAAGILVVGMAGVLLAYRQWLLFYCNYFRPRFIMGIRPDNWSFPNRRYDVLEWIRSRPAGHTFVGLTPVRLSRPELVRWERFPGPRDVLVSIVARLPPRLVDRVGDALARVKWARTKKALAWVEARWPRRLTDAVHGALDRVRWPRVSLTRWEPVYVPQKQRAMHMQTLGRTGSGKTSSVIWNFVQQDALDGKGICVIDGKGSDENINAMKALAAAANRAKDLRILALPAMTTPTMFSMTYNLVYVRPHKDGEPDADVQAMAERVFSALPLGNHVYFINLSFVAWLSLCRILYGLRDPTDPTRGIVFNVKDILACLKGIAPSINHKKDDKAKAANKEATTTVDGDEDKAAGDWQAGLEYVLKHTTDQDAADNLRSQIARLGRDIHAALSGLVGVLDRFQAPLINSYNPDVIIQDVVDRNLILYCQLPANLFKIQAPAIAKILLADLQQEGSLRQVHRATRSQVPFAVTIDEAARFADQGLLSSLAMLRDSNFEFTLAHQSPADLEAVSKEFAASVWDNTRTKVVLSQSNPQLCEMIAKSIGTIQKTEVTVRTEQGPLWTSLMTGAGSSKMIDAFKLHPNGVKNLAPVGQGYLYAVDKVLPLCLSPLPLHEDVVQKLVLKVNDQDASLGLNLEVRAKRWKEAMRTGGVMDGTSSLPSKTDHHAAMTQQAVEASAPTQQEAPKAPDDVVEAAGLDKPATAKLPEATVEAAAAEQQAAKAPEGAVGAA